MANQALPTQRSGFHVIIVGAGGFSRVVDLATVRKSLPLRVVQVSAALSSRKASKNGAFLSPSSRRKTLPAALEIGASHVNEPYSKLIETKKK